VLGRTEVDNASAGASLGMAYTYFDSGGFLADGPTIHGQRDLRRALARRRPSWVVREYLREGCSEEPRELARDLCALLPVVLAERSDTAVEVRRLIRAARRADGILILSDGC
jgi:hypothetical protein